MKVYFVFAAILIGLIGIFVNLGGTTVHPFVLGFYRVFFGFICLSIITPFLDRNTFVLKNKNMKLNAFIGLLFAVNFTGTNIAYLYAPVQSVAFILATTPAFVLVFAYFMLGESVTKTKLVALGLTLLGLFLLNPFRPEGLFGNILALCIVAIGGFMFTLLRKINMKETIGNIFWWFFFASLYLLPMPFIYGFGTLNLSIVALGVLSTGLAYLFYNLGYEKTEAETGNLITNIVTPLTAICLGIIILGEVILPRVIAGGIVLLIAAIYLKTHLKQLHHG